MTVPSHRESKGHRNGRKYWFQMRVTLPEREELKLAAAFAGCSIAEYLWGLHEARNKGEIFPEGSRIIRAATELAAQADQAAKDLALLGYPQPKLRQTILDLRSTISDAGRPIPARRKKKVIQKT